MKQFAIWTCSAAVLGLVAITTDTAVTEAGAQSREEYCHRQAKRKSKRAQRPGEAALGAGLGSAAVGAIIGGIVGGGKGAGRGAIIGGSVGAVSGAVASSGERDRIYNQIFDDCMAGYTPEPARVYSEPPVYAEAPEPWTDEWYDYCRSKFRSFNPETGRYKTYSGHYRLCR